ncbi:MAG: IS30 family transposase [Firmicutes bacterium]|nr:IS30 family transposase [Bacillota bacterium]
MTKQLSLSERIVIERMISSDFTFATIARHLHRSPSTISREVRNHRGFVEKFTPPGKNDCVKRHSCLRNNICDDVPVHGCYFYRCKKCPDRSCFKICTAYVSERCPKLDKPPYVCTHCEKRKDCKHIHAYYTAHRAHAEYTKQLSSARSGIRKTREELEQIERIIEPLIKRGQSPAHICATHGSELGISECTLYNYIDSCAFKVRNIDLPKKVAYRRRRKKKVLTRFEYKCRMGRTYEDFKSYIKENPNLPIVEMDTVKGSRTKDKVLLTMIFRKSSFMLIFLMPDGTQESVISVFDTLTALLGEELFQRLFSVILTDNGVEFKDVDSLEYSPKGLPRARLFYCDPQASWQKPQVENNHKLIRRILPRGRRFDALRSSDVFLITNHINSVIRDNLMSKSPFELMVSEDEKKLLSLLQLQPIPPDEVVLKPTLIKH